MNTGANCPGWGQEGVPLWEEEEGDLLPPISNMLDRKRPRWQPRPQS